MSSAARRALVDRADPPAAARGLVGFHGTAGTAERRVEHAAPVLLHGLTDAVPEEPCGFHAATEGSLKLAGAMPFLLEQIRYIAWSQIRRGAWLELKSVPMRTVKGFRQA